ncbi:MAG: cytochrome c [Bdellovibrionaceae bacterium]|nr:cytochrome c [Pseudobdellovibrionaceae bacterium]
MKALLVIAALSSLALTACGPSGNNPNVELIQDMMEQPAVKGQRYDPWFKNGISALVPPEHTQPVGFTPYKYGTDIQAAIRENKNPLAGNMEAETLMVGQKYFNTNCMICHGQHGRGDGPIAKKYPLPIPSLMSDKIRGWNDANIYHVITMGQGTMGPYASHIPQAYRWQVVNYIRYLQKDESK